jgi:hypothetical protein
MMLGEEFGVHLPRALTTFIAGLGPIGPALEAAFPFMAIALGATLLIEHLAKMHEAGEKLTDDQVRFGTAVNNAFNSLDEKIIQARIRADELRNDHLGALRLQLELIDKQSMAELIHSFEEVAKAADVVMKDLEGHWYTFGIGSDGANHALQQFRTQWESLAAQGKNKEASDLLAGTRQSAEHILDMMKQYKANQTVVGGDNPHGGDYNKFEEAALELKKAGVGVTEKEFQAQQNLVSALRDVTGLEGRVNELKNLDKANAGKSESNHGATQAAAAARQAAESQARLNEQTLAGERATADALLTVHRASIEQRLASEIAFAGRDRDIQLSANQAEIAGLDRSGKDYQNQLKALKEKTLEINGEYAAKVAELNAKASTEEYSRDLRELEQSERKKIDATREGTAARLAVIDEAIKEEQSKNLQGTNFFSELLDQHIEAVRRAAEEEAKVKDAAIKQEIAAEDVAAKEKTRHSSAMNTIEKPKSTNDSSAKAAELDREYQANHAELLKELADSQSMGQAKVAEQRKINDQIAALDREHQDRMAENAAAQAQAEKAAAMETANAWGQSLLKVGQGHESMAKVAQTAFSSMISASLQAALMQVAHEKTAQLAHAEAAAAAAFHAMSGIPVVGPALGAVAAAATFAGAMAFEEGGVVPGVGRGDIVPSMLSPGEGIVPGGVMDGLSKMARSGNMGGGVHYHIASPHFSPTIHALDADGVDEILEKHADKFHKAFERTVRRLNH